MAKRRKNAKEIAMEGIAGMGGAPVSVDDDLASLNPIRKPGTTPWQVDDYNKSKNWTKPGVTVPELNPNLEYEGNLKIKPIATKKTVTANKISAVKTPKPPVNLNVGGPKKVPGVETGWIKEDGAPLKYRQYTPTAETNKQHEKYLKKQRKAAKKNIN